MGITKIPWVSIEECFFYFPAFFCLLSSFFVFPTNQKFVCTNGRVEYKTSQHTLIKKTTMKDHTFKKCLMRRKPEICESLLILRSELLMAFLKVRPSSAFSCKSLGEQPRNQIFSIIDTHLYFCLKHRSIVWFSCSVYRFFSWNQLCNITTYWWSFSVAKSWKYLIFYSLS